uniref:G_PROTEIN_RECEP_F1_2 domain-containing protein n=1 Tax=Caenorhabditis tropicalis TaxID=1561998 RepID=A0A1I7UFA9_9PELO
MLYKGFYLIDQPCQLLVTDEHCVPYTELLYMGISGMIYSQTGAIIERAIATFHPNYTSAMSRIIGISITSIVFVLSSTTYRIILWDDPLDGVILNCFTIAHDSYYRQMVFLVIAVLLTLFNLIASMAVMYYNKRLEYRIRYKVHERFKKREAIDSTHTICIVSMSQFMTMLIYSLGLLLLKSYQQSLELSVYLGLIVWIYVIPYSALLFPLILIYQIRATKVSRVKKIRDITTTKQTQMEHMKQISSIWNK